MAIVDLENTERHDGEATTVATIMMARLEEKAQERLSKSQEDTATDVMHELSFLHSND